MRARVVLGTLLALVFACQDGAPFTEHDAGVYEIIGFGDADLPYDPGQTSDDPAVHGEHESEEDEQGEREVRDHGFKSLVVATGLEQATAFAFAAGERIFVAEKKGIVRVLHGGELLERPFLDLRAQVNAPFDRGLLGLAVHPRFPDEPYLYLLYTYDPPEVQALTGGAGPDGPGARAARLIRVEADPENDYATARPNSALVLLGTNSTSENIGRLDARNDYEHPACGLRGAYVRDCLPVDEVSHSVGAVAFGPDGMLYVSNGDGCAFDRAQPACTRALDLDSLSGKILRIDPISGRGLPDNPYAEDDLDANRAKVYQLGLRNPFRFSFDSQSGALYVGDVGWNTWEEINRAGPGANFGWPCHEGGNGVSLPQSAYQELARCAELEASGEELTPALYGYTHEGTAPGQGSAVLVGDVYRGTRYPPLYRGALFYSDFNRRQMRFLAFDQDGNVESSQVFAEGIGFPTQISADPSSGDLFVLQIGGSPEAPESSLSRLVFSGYGPGPAPDALYTIRTSGGEQCLEASADESSGEPETALEAHACDGSSAQHWLARNAGDNLYRFESEASARAITVQHAGAQGLSLALPSDDAAQRFRVFPLGDGFQLIDDRSELCLAAPGSDPRVIAAQCAKTPAQLFDISSEANRRPTIVPMPLQTMTVGDQVLLRVFAEDAEGAALTFFESGLPKGASIDPQSGVIMGQLTYPGTYTVRVGVTDGQLETSTSFYWIVQDDKLPSVWIEVPADGSRLVPGELVEFAGSAQDHEGNPLSAEQLQWELYVHHNQHVHFGGLPPTEGPFGSFLYEDHGDNTSLELCLIATDDTRRVGRSCRVLLPSTVEYTIESVPSGLTLAWNGVPQQTPFTVQTNVGSMRDLIAPLAQEGYAFAAWSDGGSASHVISIASEPQRLIASYAPRSNAQ